MPPATRVKKNIKLSAVLVFISALLVCPLAGWADYAVVGDDGYEVYAEEPDQQQKIADAQKTLASLFGKNATLAIPPQMAGGTIELPSFHSSDSELEASD